MINKASIKNAKYILCDIERIQGIIEGINESTSYGQCDVTFSNNSFVKTNRIAVEKFIPFDEVKRRAIIHYKDELETLQEKLRLELLSLNK